jgi:hypothetical protein
MTAKSKITGLLAAGALLGATFTAAAARPDQAADIALYYSDGSPPSLGLDAVNAQLMSVGVRVGLVSIPDAAAPLLRVSRSRALTAAESAGLIDLFRLDRRDLLAEIARAGRQPAVAHGGRLQTSEKNVLPYPKVYDMRALDESWVVFLQHKFGRLHVNRSETGEGIDEVMTIVSGGPYTWFFVLRDGVVGKLRLGAVDWGDRAWRISYPGLVPHGGYFDAPHGLVVAHAHGPEQFVMRYKDPAVAGSKTLGGNPWIDFNAPRPVLREHPDESVKPPAFAGRSSRVPPFVLLRYLAR